jgi:hypothetical protein
VYSWSHNCNTICLGGLHAPSVAGRGKAANGWSGSYTGRSSSARWSPRSMKKQWCLSTPARKAAILGLEVLLWGMTPGTTRRWRSQRSDSTVSHATSALRPADCVVILSANFLAVGPSGLCLPRHRLALSSTRRCKRYYDGAPSGLRPPPHRSALNSTHEGLKYEVYDDVAKSI